MSHRFYAIQTTSGHENKVRSLIQRIIDADPAAPEARAIRQALVPAQDVVEIKNGKKVTVERKVYPGYVLVETELTQDALHTINGLQGVIKFVGKDRDPQPLRRSRLGRFRPRAQDRRSGRGQSPEGLRQSQKGGRASPTGTLTNGQIQRAASIRIGSLPGLPRGVRLIMVRLTMLGAGCAAHEQPRCNGMRWRHPRRSRAV